MTLRTSTYFTVSGEDIDAAEIKYYDFDSGQATVVRFGTGNELAIQSGLGFPPVEFANALRRLANRVQVDAPATLERQP